MGLMGKAVLLYLCMALAVSFWQPDLVIGDNKSILTIFHVGVNQTTNEPYINSKDQNFANSGMNSQFDETQEKTGIFRTFINQINLLFQVFFDGLWMIIGVIKIFFKFAFSPILIFTTPEMASAPLPVVFFMLFPLMFMFIMGIVYIIRSGQ